MKAVLLLASPTLESPRAYAYAIERAQALAAKLIVVAVIDPVYRERVERHFEDDGCVGEKVAESLLGCLERDLRAQSADLVETIAAQARGAGVSVETVVDEGDLGEIAGRCCAGYEIPVAVVAAEKRSWISRMFGADDDVQRTLRLPRCEIKVVDG